MIRTHGLTHISLSVADPEVSLAFYWCLFGVREYYRDQHCIQVLGPGKYDVLAFERRPRDAGRGGIHHFGFRLPSPEDIQGAAEQVVAAGGTILKQGEHAPGEPYLSIQDPDGNEIEIWYEGVIQPQKNC